MTRPFRVTSFDHIVLNCRDVEASIGFYVDALGLEPVRIDEWRSNEAPFPSVRVSTDTIIDLFASEPDGANLDHFCLVVDDADLDAIAEAFPGSRKADNLFGARGYASSVYLSDPDGNGVELRSYS